MVPAMESTIPPNRILSHRDIVFASGCKVDEKPKSGGYTLSAKRWTCDCMRLITVTCPCVDGAVANEDSEVDACMEPKEAPIRKTDLKNTGPLTFEQ